MNVKSFRRLAFACFTIVLNTGNLYELKFVNNEDLPNTGNLDFTLRPVARIFYGEVLSNEETDLGELISQWREPLLCREYFFLATENSWYLKLSSKTKGYTKKEQCIP